MDLEKLIEEARRLDVPELVALGVSIAQDAAEFARLVAVNAGRADAVLKGGTRSDLNAIHAEALAAADALDAALAAVK